MERVADAGVIPAGSGSLPAPRFDWPVSPGLGIFAPMLRRNWLVPCVLAVLGLVAAVPSVKADGTPPAPSPDAPVVLHIGDSFAQSGFSQVLKPMFQDAGARYVLRARQSLYIPTIVNALDVRQLMRTYTPQLVIINIGANEMRMPQPEDHAYAVKAVSSVIGTTSCVWVTPPPPVPQGQTGIVEIMKRDSSPCRVFDSGPLAATLPRGGDKIHPNKEGGAIWARAFWDWLQQERDPSKGPFALKPRTDGAPSEPAAAPQ